MQDNLIPFNKLTKEEQRKLASKGGKASVKARQERKTLKEELLLLLDRDDNQTNMTVSLIKRALEGDIKAFEVVRDTIGEKPTDKVESNSNITVSAYKELSLEELKKLAK